MRFFSVFITALILAGCAPGLGSSVNLGSVGKVEVESLSVFSEADKVRLNVMNFTDNRTMEAIAQIDGRLVKPDGDVADAAKSIFESTAKAAGIKLSLFNAPSVRGYVNEWRVSVVPGFPASKAEATATVTIELLDRESYIVHRSIYSGSFAERNPFLDDSKVQAALGRAMAYAIAEVFKDQLFISRLNAAANFANELNY